ncbi:M20 family metallopeptidase [Paracoccus kondratievae]|uniref:Peptidase M20 n=1 Tax=Paracoccus kondratievae TaxID=135740 RepID=A0AAD3RTG0_9RHOB|nr:M20 family metallopeptidase [Paracoccus kondratievae]GLK63599.1 peptidase M20 [Paracoccus kondratievae]
MNVSTPFPSAETVQQITADIIELVECESHSYDRQGLDACLSLLIDLTERRLGKPAEMQRYPGGEQGDIVTLTYPGSGTGHIAIIGHYDTVWPRGTLAAWGERSSQDDTGRLRLSGPGILDMKTGVVQGIWALRLARESGLQVPTVTFLFNGDEEIGSLASRKVIENVTAPLDATLVLEPSHHGAVKTERKGVGLFKVIATGVESHAGLNPAAGASAIHAMAEFITAIIAAADPAKGTTINAGLIEGGTGSNVVAGRCAVQFDIRVRSLDEQARIDTAFDAATVSDPRVKIEVRHNWNRPPMELTKASQPLLEHARQVASELGFALQNVAVGGASDANFVAGLGRPVLCGLGAVGDGAHARNEFIYADMTGRQTALLTGIIQRLANGI